MRRRIRTPLALLAVLALASRAARRSTPSARPRRSSPPPSTTSTTSSPQGSVKYNDLDVGLVDSIELTEDDRALVTMSLDPDAPVPADVEAVLAKTSVLGERYIDLVPVGDDPACCIEDGTRIEATSVRTDLEDLVAAGSGLLVDVSADAVRTTIEVGAEAFGGRSQLISGFVDDVNSLVVARSTTAPTTWSPSSTHWTT